MNNIRRTLKRRGEGGTRRKGKGWESGRRGKGRMGGRGRGGWEEGVAQLEGDG